MQKFLDTCPGLAGDIARYIDSALAVKQPGMCLAAALSFVGALYSGRIYCTSNNSQQTEPCVFVIVVADTGAGKTSSQKLVRKIMTSALGSKSFLIGVPASDSGLLKALTRTPRGFLIWDEIGLGMAAIAKSRELYNAKIFDAIMTVFSSAGVPYTGKEYSTQDRVDISEPYLSILGGSTWGCFFDSLNKGMIENGFLTRFLLFCEAEESVEKEARPDSALFQSIVSRVQAVNKWVSVETAGNLAEIVPDEMPHKKVEVQLPHECRNGNMFSDLEMWGMEIAAIRKSNKKSSVTKLMYSRAWEHTIRMCLAFTDCQHQTPVISPESVRFAIDLTRALIDDACLQYETHIYPDQRTREHNNLRDRINESLNVGESITNWKLNRRIRGWGDPQACAKAIEDLLCSGSWDKALEQVEDSRQKSTIFTRVE